MWELIALVHLNCCVTEVVSLRRNKRNLKERLNLTFKNYYLLPAVIIFSQNGSPNKWAWERA